MTTTAGETAGTIVQVEEELTPEHLRCSYGSCPGVYRASDGDLVIIGKIPSQAILQQIGGKIGEDEFSIKISPAFFKTLFERD